MKACALLLLALLPVGLRADDDPSEPLPGVCEVHTPKGTVTGRCTTQSVSAPGYNVRWKLTLAPDERSAALAAALPGDHFYDMMRSQCLEDGSLTVILPLWGDFRIKPDSEEYYNKVKVWAPLYETRPNQITVARTSDAPLTLEFLFEERASDFDPVLRVPYRDWVIGYLESYYRLGTNRTDGFSR